MAKAKAKPVAEDGKLVLTNKQLLNSLAGMQEISSLKNKIKTSYALSKIMIEIQKHLDLYNLEANKILENNSKRDAKGQMVPLGTGGFELLDSEKYRKDLAELLEIKVEIDVKKISLAMLGGNEISVGAMVNLAWLIEE